MITVVSAFIPIPGHPRSEEEYHQLAAPLREMQHDRVPLMIAHGDIKDCWLFDHLCGRYDMDTSQFSYSVDDNPQKNSLAYHIVQAQKTEWLELAATMDCLSDVFVWIDYGIFHVPGVTVRVLEEFFKRVEGEKAIAIPGCWEHGEFSYDDNHPCWRFCGGVMVVPRKYVRPLNLAMKREYVRWLEENHNISWEVNTLARVEWLEPDLPFWWYKADHNQTLFTNYKATEDADGRPFAPMAQRHAELERY
jgi:hypothetical protein